jgi:hypothetical protein
MAFLILILETLKINFLPGEKEGSVGSRGVCCRGG